MTDLTMIAKELDKVIAEFAAERGLTLDTKVRMRGGRMSLTVTALDEDTEADLFALNSGRFGYEPEWLNRSFLDGRHVFKVVGVKPTAEKNCLRLMRDDGREFVAPVAFVRPKMKAAA